MKRFDNKVALITGAGGKKNMGRSTALLLAGEGAKVVLTDLPPEDPRRTTWKGAPEGWRGIFTTAEEIQHAGGTARAIPADLSLRADLERLVHETLQAFGRVDILVNCAALRARPWSQRLATYETPDEEWEMAFRVNVTAPFVLSKLLIPGMIARGQGGRIINVSSLAGKKARYMSGPYSASKFALIGLTQVLALEVGRYGITVNAVCPGFTDTDRMDHFATPPAAGPEAAAAAEAERRKQYADWSATNPLGRVTQPEDIANTIAFLASSDASDINGQSINVCGGALLS